MLHGVNFQKIECSALTVQFNRLDHYLAEALKISRQKVKVAIKEGLVSINDVIIKKPSYKINNKDHLVFHLISEQIKHEFTQVLYESNSQIVTDQYNIPIIFEDDQLLVINKPFGLVVHPAPTIKEITLTEILHSAGIQLALSENRPGIVHRLDQFTEGLLIIAKTYDAFLSLQEQFRVRSIRKFYYAVLVGNLVANEGTIDKVIGRDVSVRARQSCNHYVLGTEKEAVTHYTVLNRTTTVSFVDINLVTGRTHQIRVHFSAMNCPVLGDSLYSSQKQRDEGYYLQAYFIEFDHPKTKEKLSFSLPVSDRLKQYANKK